MLKTVGNPSTRYGNQTIVGGNLVIGTSGNGIDFSANANAPGATSELLDDYEEGTWTPEIADASSGGNVATIGTTYASYTKIGNTVVLHLAALDINVTGLTAGNILFIRGLPFLSANNPRVHSAGSIIVDRIGATGSYVNPYVEYNRTFMVLQASSVSAAVQDAPVLVSGVGSPGSDIQALTVVYEAV